MNKNRFFLRIDQGQLKGEREIQYQTQFWIEVFQMAEITAE
jgi:hypothetical protein